MKRLIELGQAIFIVGMITGIIPTIALGLIYKIFGL